MRSPCQYQPFSRPLFIYVNLRSSSNRQLLSKFVILYINKVAKIADSVGYVPLPEAVRDINYIHFNPVKHGLVTSVSDWPHSSFHRYVRQGILPPNWGSDVKPSDSNFGEP